jgi:hypothetical protein
MRSPAIPPHAIQPNKEFQGLRPLREFQEDWAAKRTNALLVGFQG